MPGAASGYEVGPLAPADGRSVERRALQITCQVMYYLVPVLLVPPSGDAVLTSCDRAEGVYREFRLSAGHI